MEIGKIKCNNIWLLSDLHFGVRANSVEWSTNMSNYFYDFFIPLIKNNMKKGDILFFLGDLFDNRQTVDININNILIDIIDALSKILPVHILCGNHDLYKKNDTDVNSLKPFKYIENVYVYESPIILTNGKKNILVLPWLGEKSDINDYVSFENTTVDYIFAHTDIQGFKYDNGREIAKGLDLNNIDVKLVLSGHIHKRQRIKNWIYIGSPYHTKRSDTGNVKGIYMLDTSVDDVTFTENTYSPKIQTIKLKNLLLLNLSEIKNIFANNYTYITVTNEFINLFNISKFTELLKGCDFKSVYVLSEAENALDSNINIESLDSMSIVELIEKAIENNIDDKYDKSLLKQLNEKYYNISKTE